MGALLQICYGAFQVLHGRSSSNNEQKNDDCTYRLTHTESRNALPLAWKLKLAHHYAELNVDYQIMRVCHWRSTVFSKNARPYNLQS